MQVRAQRSTPNSREMTENHSEHGAVGIAAIWLVFYLVIVGAALGGLAGGAVNVAALH